MSAAPKRYRKESWSPSAYCTCGIDYRLEQRGHRERCPFPTASWSWVPMEHGAAAAHWRPVADRIAAARHCYTWSGGIPAMRVVDLAAEGNEPLVVWQYAHPREDSDPGPNVLPEWHDAMVAALRDEREAERAEEEQAMAGPAPDPVEEQGSLF